MSSRSPSAPELVPDLLRDLGGSERAPGGGSLAALTVVLAAALTEKAARLAPGWDGHGGCAAQARTLRVRAEPLVHGDTEAYASALAALEGAGDPAAVADALAEAAAVPLTIAAVGSDVTLLAAAVADLGDPALRPDAHVAVLLAEAATRSAARLVVENLNAREGDPRVSLAREFANAAGEARDRIEL
jgi:formiminotetrahydrofolate cyclodeaminase